MYIVRCKNAVSGNWTTHFYDTLENAFYYVKATKNTKCFSDDVIFLTRENSDSTTIYSGQYAPEIWHLKG